MGGNVGYKTRAFPTHLALRAFTPGVEDPGLGKTKRFARSANTQVPEGPGHPVWAHESEWQNQPSSDATAKVCCTLDTCSSPETASIPSAIVFPRRSASNSRNSPSSSVR